ncbi:MAG: hypothetical protein NTY98_03665 [Verrucomicrobia bacterium]|nr:hypothetical protein [Verrucomicrobiota bacterium]
MSIPINDDLSSIFSKASRRLSNLLAVHDTTRHCGTKPSITTQRKTHPTRTVTSGTPFEESPDAPTFPAA